MPIQAENRHRYPPEWPLISLWMRVCAGWRCEWCNAEHGEPHPVTRSLVVLTVAHIENPAPEDVRPANLAALCQRCHLNHDRRHHLAVQAANRRKAMRTIDLFEFDAGARELLCWDVMSVASLRSYLIERHSLRPEALRALLDELAARETGWQPLAIMEWTGTGWTVDVAGETFGADPSGATFSLASATDFCRQWKAGDHSPGMAATLSDCASLTRSDVPFRSLSSHS
jgi:hypothetical protein